MNELVFFNYNGKEIRTVENNGELWWVLADVCRVLDYKNPTMVLERLDEDEKAKSDLGLSGGLTNIINESGLYSVILRSDKPEAKPFRRWITHEVIPEIRKTGCYRLPRAETIECKWYGENVIMLSEAVKALGISKEAVRQAFREGLDRFTLTGNALKRFKIENGIEKSPINSVTLIRADVYYSIRSDRIKMTK